MNDRIEQPASDLPAGFKRTDGGLIVPIDSQPLERERWRKEDSSLVRRVERFAREKQLLFILGCNDNRCAEAPQIQMERVPGGYVFRCRHKERFVY